MEQLVLDDAMLILFERFRAGAGVDDLACSTLFALMGKLKLPYKTNPDQIQRCRDKLPEVFLKEIAPSFFAGDAPNESLEDMAMHTLYKIILTDKEARLPFVNIFSERFSNDFNIYLKKNEPRDELHEYIKSCLVGSNKIIITDRYLENALDRGYCNLEKMIPDDSIEIVCNEHISENQKFPASAKLRSYMLQYCRNKISSKSYNFDNIHDRYITIEYPNYKYQIICSSGIEYLFCDQKEITCIFRKQ